MLLFIGAEKGELIMGLSRRVLRYFSAANDGLSAFVLFVFIVTVCCVLLFGVDGSKVAAEKSIEACHEFLKLAGLR